MKPCNHSLICIILACAMTLCLVPGCSKTSEDVIRDAVKAEFDPYKNLEDEALSRIASIAEDEGLSDIGISGAEFASSVLQGFDYSIDDVSIEGENAFVTVTIRSKSASDFDDKISKRVQRFIESESSQKLAQEDKAQEIGSIALDSIRDAKLISQQVEFEFHLEDKTWISENASAELSKLDMLAYRG